MVYGLWSVVCITPAFADTHYVDVTSTNSAPPYTNWAMAATVIQDAIDVSSDSDMVLVADGIYSNGGLAVYPAMTNRIAITKAITVVSMNGPEVTTITGQGVGTGGTNNGPGAIRCAYLTNGATLSGFTLTGGHTRGWGDGESFKELAGGGVFCEYDETIVTNCIIRANSACDGGGAARGTIRNCLISNNVAQSSGGGVNGSTVEWCVICANIATHNILPSSGGGASGAAIRNSTLWGNSALSLGGGANGCTLENCAVYGNTANSTGGGAASCNYIDGCTIVNNSAVIRGGGVYQAPHIRNSIVYYNKALLGENYSGDNTWPSYTCTTPVPAGVGNFADSPGLLGLANPHIVASSPCIDAGNNAFAVGSQDVDGNARTIGPKVDVGCDEFCAASITGNLHAAISAPYTFAAIKNVLSFTADISGLASRFEWRFGDGIVATNQTIVAHAWDTPGQYNIVLTAWNNDGVASATTSVQIVSSYTNYVSLAGMHLAPYTNWTTAATNIQSAIDTCAMVGGMTLVTDGVYKVGAVAVYGSMSNRIAIKRPMRVSSVNGPLVTVIEGKGVGSGGTNNGVGAIRCALLTEGAELAGFTLTNGHTLSSVDADATREESGGGAWCGTGGMLTNCIMQKNTSRAFGGGVYGGVVQNCMLIGNIADDGSGGGAASATVLSSTFLRNSAYGGGAASQSTLQNCVISRNVATKGGGVASGDIRGSLLYGNVAGDVGGGVCYATVVSSTVVSNSAGNAGGGVWSGNGQPPATIQNSIVYLNTALSNANYESATVTYSCSSPLPAGNGNVSTQPQFVNVELGDCRLSPGSSCIDGGVNESWMFGATDLGGIPRILNGTVDMGAYETPFTAVIRALLQGPYHVDTGRMMSGLSSNIPLTSPYAEDNRSVASIPSNAVDWVLVEVRDGNSNSVATKSAFLDSNGSVFSSSGTTGITVEAFAGNHSIALKHRNHLALMSAHPVAFTNILVNYDFTTSPDKYLGGTNACEQLESGKWGMIAGDTDGDGKITDVDRQIVTQQMGKAGYLPGDFNLDGIVTEGDIP